VWTKVKDTIDNGDMPPKKAKQLTEQEAAAITGWVQHSLDALAEAKSGDSRPCHDASPDQCGVRLHHP